MFITKMQFHNSKDPSITYTVNKIDRKTDTLFISFFENGNYQETTFFLPMAEKFLKEGTWIKGEGSDRMTLKLVNGQKVLVDTNCMFEDQFNAEGKRYHDYEIAEILNDKRLPKDRGHWLEWQGKKPAMIDLYREYESGYHPDPKWENSRHLTGFKNGYYLECIKWKDAYYYRFNNWGSYRSFDFIYRDGVFYECNKMHYTKLAGKSGKTLAHHLNKKVTKKAQQELIDFFNNHYKEL